MAANPIQKRNNPFLRATSPSAAAGVPNGRPKSMVVSSPLSNPTSPTHTRSISSLAGALTSTVNTSSHTRSHSKNGINVSSTFAPAFINTDEMRKPTDVVKGIEGENDFSGKRYVWLKDPEVAFVKGWIVDDLPDNRILVQCDDGTVSGNYSME